MFIVFLRVEQVENLIITTVSVACGSVPNGGHSAHGQCIQMHDRLIVLCAEVYNVGEYELG